MTPLEVFDALVDALEEGALVSGRGLAARMGIPQSVAHARILDLWDMGLVSPRGKSTSVRYLPTSAGWQEAAWRVM